MLTPSFLSVWRNTSCLQFSTRKLNLCMYQEEIFLKDSESFSSHFPYALTKVTAWDSYVTPWLCMSRSNTLLSLSSAYIMTVPLSLTQGPGPNSPCIGRPSIGGFFGWVTQGLSLSDQQKEMIGQHTSQSTGMDTKVLYSTTP